MALDSSLVDLAKRLELANKSLARERSRLAELLHRSEILWQQIQANHHNVVRDANPQPEQTGLTAREIQVLTLIAEGSSSKAIAERLGIAFKTAVCHRTRLMAKLRIHDTAGLVRYAIRYGLIKA